MNKFFTKIAKTFLGLSMAIGVGVAVGAGRKDASPVHAASAQWQLVTSAPSDWSGEYIIASGNTGSVNIMDGSAFANGGVCSGASVTVSDSKITADTADALTIAKSSTSGKYTVMVNGYYIGKNANSNGIDASTTWSTNLNNDITLSSGKVVIKGNGGRVLTWLNSNSNYKYYAASNNSSYLYRKVASYTLSFNANGGSGTVPSNITGSGSKTLPSSASLSKTGYTLDGWGENSHKDDATAQYALGASYNLTSTTTLYAHWSINKYSVSASITNGGFTGTTGANAATYGIAYNATITASTDYNLPSELTVTMGGEPTNAYTYNSGTGAFSIATPTGNISISGECTPNATEYGMSVTATNGTYSGDTAIYAGHTASITFSPNAHFKLPADSSAFTVNHAEIQSYNSTTGVLVLENPDDDVTVSVSMVNKAQNSISMGTLTGVRQADGNPTSVEEGATVTLTFVANENYGLPTDSGVTVTGTGATSIWTQGTGRLQITGGTGNITVSITGIVRSITSLTLSSNSGSYELGDSFTMPTVTANYNVGASENVTSLATATGDGLENGILTSVGTKTITISYGGQSATYTATVTKIKESSAKFVKVESGTVASGKYLIVNETALAAFDGSINSTSYDTTSNIVTVAISNKEIAYSAALDASSFTYDATAGTLKSAAGYYIYRNGTSSGLNAQTSAPSVTISISVSDGDATISHPKDSSTMRLRYNNSSGQDRFRFYNSNSVQSIQIYKYQEAVEKQLKWITAVPKAESYYKGNSVTASDFTVTAHYNDGSTSTPTTGITVTNSALTALGQHDVTLSYGGKSCVVQVTVVYAPVTSVVLDTPAASIGLDESYWLSDIGVTVNPSITSQDVTWELYDDGVLEEITDYTFDGDEFHSINPGTVVFHCKSDLDSSKYGVFTLTIAGDPIASFAKDSTSGYTGKDETISFTYGNFDTEDLEIISNNPSYVTIGTISASEGSGTVVVNFVGAGTTSVTISDGVSTLDTLTVTVTADSVTAVTWSASNLDVWSGDTLSTTGWNVQYEMASGDSGSASSYTIKLVGQITETITSGYSFKGSDNGKTIHVEYGGVSSSSITVTVTQRINNVMAPTYSENNWSHELSAKTWSALGAQTINGKAWTAGGTDDGTEYLGWDSTKGQQFGSGNHPFTSVTLSSSAFSGTVSTVKITTSGAKDISATVAISVGGTAFKRSGSESVSITQDSTEYTFIGTGTGTITITWTNSSAKAIYFKALAVTTLTEEEPVQIANNASHKAAQRVAVKFADAFNAAMDTTENCTTGLDAAWATCSSAYNTFKSEAAALGSTEEAWAKNLVKCATAQYSDDSGEACLERMMKTYEVCVQKHGKTAFMSDLVTISASQGSPLIHIIGENTNTVAIIVIISMVSVTAIGGYFFLRKRREEN